MRFSKSVRKVLLVVFLHEALVVYKENVSRHRDGCVAIIDSSGGVEKLEASGATFCLRWFFLKGFSEESIKLTCSDRFLSGFPYFSELAENESDGLFL